MEYDRERLPAYCENPPPGSALEAAIAFGIDPTLTLRNVFALTPEQRLAQADQMIARAASLDRLRRARDRA